MSKKGITLILDDRERQELYRIILDDDREAALAFIKERLRSPLLEALEGGCKVLIEVPGAGIRQVSGQQITGKGGLR